MIPRRLVLMLLLFSLAINIGAVTVAVITRVRQWHRDERTWRLYYRERASLARLDRVFREYSEASWGFNELYDDLRPTLGRLAFEPEPDPAEVETALDRVEQFYRESGRLLNRTMAANYREWKEERLAAARRRGPGDIDSARQLLAERWHHGEEK